MAAFVGLMMGTLVDPMSIAGYVTIGIFTRRISFALAYGASWAVAMEIFAHAAMTHPFDARVLMARIAGALLAICIVFLFARVVRKARRH